MPRSKKTRMKFTDQPEPRHIRKMKQARREVAAEAARILATEGQHNYHAAKKKAAERLGVSERLALPSNLEVKDALLSYQALYGGADHRDTIENMRRVAARVMQELQPFQPRLVGSVLDGTANAHSRIALHIFPESVESAILFLADRNVPFSQEERQIRWFNGQHRQLPVLVFEFEGADVEMMVFQPVNLRQSPPSPIDGRPQHRASLSEVEYLLAKEAC
jgi:hypothetical protein